MLQETFESVYLTDKWAPFLKTVIQAKHNTEIKFAGIL